MSAPSVDLMVAGAGMVGVSCALWARSRGMSVLLLDGERPGSGASYGNAGTIATYACIPVNDPSIPRRLPQLLFSSHSPLAIDWSYALRHPRWMLAFLRNCSRSRVRTISDRLGDLLAHADAGLNPLLELAAADDLMVSNDCLYVYSTQTGFEGAGESHEARRRNGVHVDVLDEASVRDLEPALRMPVHKGLLFRGARHVRDPQALVTRFFDRFVSDGGQWVQSHVREAVPGTDGVTVMLADGSSRRAARLVIAAGAHARSIRGSGAEHVPLDTERGYHLMYQQHGALLSRPVGWADAGLYATPMDSGLRIAGTVELAGLHRPPRRGRIAYLERRAREMFGELGRPDADWLGFRPTFPDALPAIGPSPDSDRILFAFGHQHVGLTLGGITGRIVADLAEGRAPNLDISAYDPRRFVR